MFSHYKKQGNANDTRKPYIHTRSNIHISLDVWPLI